MKRRGTSRIVEIIAVNKNAVSCDILAVRVIKKPIAKQSPTRMPMFWSALALPSEV